MWLSPSNRNRSRNTLVSQFHFLDSRRSLLGIQTNFLNYKRKQPWEDTERPLWRRKPTKRGEWNPGEILVYFLQPTAQVIPALKSSLPLDLSQEPTNVILWTLVCVAFPVTCSSKLPGRQHILCGHYKERGRSTYTDIERCL